MHGATSANAPSIGGPDLQQSISPSATSRTTGFVSGPRSIEADNQLQDGSDTRNQRRDSSRRIRMIEAEWWEYDPLDELADAVAGDVGFIIDSAVEARNASLIAV